LYSTHLDWSRPRNRYNQAPPLDRRFGGAVDGVE
jgi:hypothetical protein